MSFRSFGLGQEARILKANEYATVFKGGKFAKGKYWQIVAKPINASTPRLGLAISKKAHRLAVDRNRYKRIARETFRVQKQQLEHWDFVVMARRSKSVKNAILSAELLDLMKKVTQD